MRVVFISGPYQARGRRSRDQYVRRALEALTTVWNIGGAPCCPSLTALGLGEFVAHAVLVAGGREMLRRSDCVYVVGPKSNADVRGDITTARHDGIPVYTSDDMPTLRDFLQAE